MDRPDCYLASSEHRGEWNQVRECRIQRVLRDADGTAFLLVAISPAAGMPNGLPLMDVVLGPHFAGTTLDPLPKAATAVYVFVPKSSATLTDGAFSLNEHEMLAWAEIYDSRTAAEAAVRNAAR